MELKNIFKMTKTDRYTQDGRDELAKLQETEDVKYKTGDISQKTGLQKQPDGSWAPPKNAGKNVHGAEIDKIYEKHQKRIKELKAKGYTDEQIENDKIYQQTKEDMRNVGKSKPTGKNGPSRMKKEEAIRKDLGLRGENDLDRFSDEQIEMMYQKSQRTPEQQKADFDNSKLGQAYNKARKEYDDHQAAYKNSQRKRDAEKEIGVAEALERMYEARGKDNEAAAAREYRNAAENLMALTGEVENLPRNVAPDDELQQKIQAAQKHLDEARVKARPDAGESAGTNYQEKVEQNPRDGYNFEKMIQHRIPTSQTDREELKGLRSFMNEEKATYQNALKSRAQALVDGHKSNGDWYPEKEQSIMKIAKAVGFDEELHKFIEEENRGYDLGYSEDAAPKIRELTGDTRIRVKK